MPTAAQFLLTPLLLLLVFSAGAGAVETTNNLSQPRAQGGGSAEALRLAAKERWGEARRAAPDQLTRDMVDWMAYTGAAPGSGFGEISDFIKRHPDWPQLNRLRLEAEKHIPENLAPADTVAWFGEHQPLTPSGMEKYTIGLLKKGDVGEARKKLRAFWAGVPLDREQQRSFYQKYNAYFDRDTNIARLNMLLYKGDFASARGIAEVLGKDYKALAEARIALSKGDANVTALIDAVPPALQNDPGLVYERLRWRRQNDLDSGAVELLAKEPEAEKMHDPSAWWKERQIMARRLIEKKNYKSAYSVASNHHYKEGVPFAEAEWLAGWIALEFIGKPWEAFVHFEKMYHGVSSPLSRSRAAYWAGRASDALKHHDVAVTWYDTAARYPTTFYGQIAAAALGREAVPDFVAAGQVPAGHGDLEQAAEMFSRAGLKYETEVFLVKLGDLAKDKSALTGAAEFAQELGQDQIAIRLAQEALSKYGVLIDESYPVIRHGGQGVERALVHALIRQESRFDEQAVSYAGARGLMQLMPATAQEVARKSGISHQTEWLTSKPEHNIRLGTGYLEQMLNRFDGNYALALAAYNAGPYRVDRWLGEFGDPRTGEISLITWIETIPISETRNYVQRVLEGVYVYRYRLGDGHPSDIPLHVALH